MSEVFRSLSKEAFKTAVAACHPEQALKAQLELPDTERLIVLAMGKASAEMAAVVEAAWPGPLEGVIVARRGAIRSKHSLQIIEAAHPVPDEESVRGAETLLAYAASAGEGDHVLVLLSGGASALACLPGEGLTLVEKQAVTENLLRSGATIEEINTVRRHLSGIKGGRLAVAAYPAAMTTYAVSDVVGDVPCAIGSGPTVADPTTLGEAKAILERYRIADPGNGWSESIKPEDPRLAASRYEIIASADMAMEAVTAFIRQQGYEPVPLGSDLEGEAWQRGREHGEIARQYAAEGRRCVLISGGELTVTVTGTGRGGPNLEYLAGLAVSLDGAPGIHGFAADTDGIDGNSGGAGGFLSPKTISAAAAKGYDVQGMLDANDTAQMFSDIGDLFVPGPTGTNVNDLRLIWIG